MKFSELLEEFVTGMIEGEPKDSEWRSISENAAASRSYHERMDYLRTAIDAALAAQGKDGAE